MITYAYFTMLRQRDANHLRTCHRDHPRSLKGKIRKFCCRLRAEWADQLLKKVGNKQKHVKNQKTSEGIGHVLSERCARAEKTQHREEP
jgi:hypothetical protein